MKCCRRSTPLFASSGLMLLLLTAPIAAGAEVPPGDAVAAAIERSVRSRVGEVTTLVVTDVSGVRIDAAVGTLLAVPEPSARLGTPARFLLSDARPGRPPVRVGEAVAVVQITAPAVRTTRAIARGERLTDADVAVVATSLDGRPLRPLPSLEEARGARATHDISMDAVLTRADLAADPLVRAGDIVRAHARIGAVEVVADMVAAASGSRGDIIRVVSQETRHAVSARVRGRGEVEVVNVR